MENVEINRQIRRAVCITILFASGIIFSNNALCQTWEWSFNRAEFTYCGNHCSSADVQVFNSSGTEITSPSTTKPSSIKILCGGYRTISLGSYNCGQIEMSGGVPSSDCPESGANQYYVEMQVTKIPAAMTIEVSESLICDGKSVTFNVTEGHTAAHYVLMRKKVSDVNWITVGSQPSGASPHSIQDFPPYYEASSSSASGIYNYQLEARNYCEATTGKSVFNKTITVLPDPPTVLSVVGKAPECKNGEGTIEVVYESLATGYDFVYTVAKMVWVEGDCIGLVDSEKIDAVTWDCGDPDIVCGEGVQAALESEEDGTWCRQYVGSAQIDYSAGDPLTQSIDKSKFLGTGNNALSLDPGLYYFIIETQDSEEKEYCNSKYFVVEIEEPNYTTIDQIPSTAYTLTPYPTKCNGRSDGEVSITVSSDDFKSESSSYVWKKSTEEDSEYRSISDNIGGYAASTEDYTVTLSNGCETKDLLGFTIDEGPQLDINNNLTKTDPTCNLNGSITLEATATGLDSYTYYYKEESESTFSSSNGTANHTLPSLGPGSFSIYVESSGCTTVAEDAYKSVTLNPTPSSVAISQTPASCYSGQGSIDFSSITKAKGDVSFAWDIRNSSGASVASGIKTDKTGFSISVDANERYTVTTSDNCNSNNSVGSFNDYVYPRQANISNEEAHEVTCYNGSDGSFSFDINHGSPPFDVTLSKGGVDVETKTVPDYSSGTSKELSFSNLALGSDYLVSVVEIDCDSEAIVASATFTIDQPTGVSQVLTLTESNFRVQNQISCHGGSDGSIYAKIEGGLPLEENEDNPKAYICYLINEEDTEFRTYSNSEDYQRNEFLFENLAAGTYRVVVEDALGCGKTFTTTRVLSKDQLTVSVDQTNFEEAVLYDGKIFMKCYVASTSVAFSPEINVNGGNPEYSYRVDDIEFTSGDLVEYGVEHKLEVIDGNVTCPSAIEYFTIYKPETALTLTLGDNDNNEYDHQKNVQCFTTPAEILASASGGVGLYTYSKSGFADDERSGNMTYSNLAFSDGEFSRSDEVTVEDKLGCTVKNTITQQRPAEIKIEDLARPTEKGGKNIDCTDGTADVSFSISGWEDMKPTISEGGGSLTATTDESGKYHVQLGAGDHVITVSDQHSCSVSSSTFNLSEPTDPLTFTAGSTIPTPPACIADSDGDMDLGTITASASGGTGPTAEYEYTFTLTDNLGELLDQTSPSSDGNVTFSAPANGINSRTYTLSVSDVNGCIATENSVVMSPTSAPLKILEVQSFPPLCNDGEDGSIQVTLENVSLREDGTFRYYLQGTFVDEESGDRIDEIRDSLKTTTTFTIPNLLDTKSSDVSQYSLFVVDRNGCTDDEFYNSIDGIQLEALDALSLTPHLTIQPSFNTRLDGMFAIEADGGAGNYQLTANDVDIDFLEGSSSIFIHEDLASGTFELDLLDGNNCLLEQDLTINQGRVLSLAGSYATDVSCAEDGSLQAIVSVNGMLADESIDLGELTVTWTNKDSKETGEVTINSDGLGSVGGLPADPYQLSASYRFASTFVDEDKLPDYSYGQDETMYLTKNLEIGQPAQLIETLSAYPALCGEDGSGRLRVQVSQPGLKYKIDDATDWKSTGSSSAFEIKGLSTDEHTLYVAKPDGSCETGSTFTIQNEPLQVSVGSEINPACHGGSDGEVVINAYFATRPGNFIYHNLTSGKSQTNGIFTDLEKGTYQFQVEDADNASCLSEIVEVQLTEPPILSPSIKLEEVSCDLFAVSSEISGGTLSYSTVYQTAAGVLVEDSTALVPGDYQLIGTDAKGCDIFLGFTVSPSETLILTSTVETTTASCSYPNGTASFSIQNGLPPYTIGEESFDTEVIELSSLTEGEKVIDVTDSRGCNMIVEFEIGSENTLELPTINSYPTTCGEENGALALNIPEGAAAPVQIEWLDMDQDADSISGLAGGNYTVRVTDGYGCSQEVTALVSNETGIQSAHWSVSSSPYCGLSNGAINIHSIQEGVAPYDIYQIEGENETWLGTINADESLAVSSLAAGNYSFQIRDQNACVFNLFGLSLEEDDSLLPGYSWEVLEPSSCEQNNGTMQVNSLQSGVVGYQWFDDAGENLNISSSVVSGIAAGRYSVFATSEDGCEQELSLELNDRAPPVLSLVSRTSSPEGASHGTITVGQTGGAGEPYQYQLESDPFQSDASFIGLAPSTYQITGRDQHGCLSNTIGVAVAATEGLSLRHLSSTAATCTSSSDGRATILASGGIAPYNYYLAGEAVDAEISELSAGSYTANVVDDIGSEATVDFDVPVLGTISVVSSTSKLYCVGECTGSLSLDITGGSGAYDVEWADGITGQSRQNLCAGSYAYQVVDAGDTSCTYSGSVTIEEEPELVINLLESSSPICYQGDNGRLLVAATGGSGSYSYLWSNESTLPFVNAAAGEYTVTVTDRNFGCTATETYIIEGTEEVVASDISVQAPLCHGTATGMVSLTIDPQASASVRWSDGQVGNIARGLSAGQYQYQITTSRGCISTGEVDVVENPALSATLTKKDNSCYGARQGEIELVVSGGRAPYRINWDHGSRSTHLRGLAAGQYSYTVYDANSCQITGSVSISQPSQLSIASYEINDLSCFASNDGRISLNLSGGTGSYDINWSNGEKSAEIQSLSTGTYLVEITDENGCQTTGSYDVNQPTPLGILSTTRIDPSCYGYEDGSIEVVPFGGTAPYLTTWSDGTVDSTIEGVGADQAFTVTVTDDHGCSLERTLRLSDPPGMQFSNVSYFDPSCYNGEDGSIQFDMVGGTMPYTYQWNELTATNQLTGLGSGTYNVAVLDENNCEVTRSFHLDNPEELFVAGLDDYYIICTGGELLLSTDRIWSSYLWTGPEDFTSEENQVLVQEEGDYSLLVRDEDNCPAYGETIVEVSDNPMDADFIRISEAVTYEPIVFVDLTTPMPDQVRWILPEDESILIEESDDVYLELIFTEPGTFDIGIEVQLSNCISESYKTVLIEAGDESAIVEQARVKQSIDVEMAPNPTQDEIRLILHVPNENKVKLQLMGSDQKLVRSEDLLGKKDYLVNWNLSNVPTGVYFLVYSHEGQVQSKRIVVIQ